MIIEPQLSMISSRSRWVLKDDWETDRIQRTTNNEQQNAKQKHCVQYSLYKTFGNFLQEFTGHYIHIRINLNESLRCPNGPWSKCAISMS